MTLLPHHARMIEESAISPEVAAARSYWSATKGAELEPLGFRPYQCLVPALVVPIRDITRRIVLHQIRPDHPRTTDAGRELKYETPTGAHLALDIHPLVAAKLGDPSIPLWLTEGSRKVDAAVSHGLVCIGVLGVDGWRGTNDQGGKTALADWEAIALNGRVVFIAYDSDVMTKQAVSLACERLRRFLKQRGARVRLVHLPSGQNGEKCGLDDFFAAGHSVEDLQTYVEQPTAREAVAAKPTKMDREVTELVDFVRAENLFHTPSGEPYASVAVQGVEQTMSVRSTALRNFLGAEFYRRHRTAPSREALANALCVFAGRAQFEGPEIEVYTRVAGGPDGAIYLDLADAEWRAVRIDRAGWNVVSRPLVRFRRAAGMLALPRPDRGSSLDHDLRPFVNVATDEDFALLVGWLVASLRDRGPYPVLILQGEQGSAKSTTARICRRCIDPNKADLRAQPRDMRDLAIAANNSWCIALDNVSVLAAWLSDALCRVSTGEGFSTRTLYTDQDETIIEVTRPILLNGIDAVATRGDLLDRGIPLNLPRLDRVREEREFWAEFEAARPRILGALLDAVSTALRHELATKLGMRVRMADAARWVVAAEPALPWEPGTFLDAYAANRSEANDLAIEASPIANELLRFLSARSGWIGTPTELLTILNERAGEKLKVRAWPKTPRGLSGALKRLAPNLRARGWSVEIGLRSPSGDQRLVSIRRVPHDEETDRQDRPNRQSLAEGDVETGTYGPDGLDPERGDPSSDRQTASDRGGAETGGPDGSDAEIPNPPEFEEFDL